MKQSKMHKPATATGQADMDLVSQVLRGQGGAFRAIMQKHNQRLYRLARSITRSDSDAEEVLQESYVRAFGALDGFRGESSLATWLSRIVINEATGRLRSTRRAARLRTGVEAGAQGNVISFPFGTPDETPEKIMAQRQLLHLVEQAADALPDGFRLVFVARVIEGLSVEETAELFGLRPETVRTRLHRARHLLRKHIEQEIGPVLMDAFPFAGKRCARLTDAVAGRLGLAD